MSYPTLGARVIRWITAELLAQDDGLLRREAQILRSQNEHAFIDDEARLKLWQKRTRSSKMELRSKLALVVMKLHHAVLIEKQGARVIFHHFPLQRHCIKGEVVKKLKDIVIRAAVAADR